VTLRLRVAAIAALSLPLLFSSCRKDLCYDHDMHTRGYRTEVSASWEQVWERDYGMDWPARWNSAAYGVEYDALRPDIPAGLAAVVYGDGADAGRSEVGTETHLSPSGGKIYTNGELCSLLFYNDDTEYIVFNDMSFLPEASATTRSRSRASYSLDEAHSDERTVAPPDMLYGDFIAGYKAELIVGYQDLAVTLKPLTYTYLLRYEFEHGREYVALARGALAGMAESVYLQDGRTGENSATLLFDCSLTPYGVEARVLSFGVPDFPDKYYKPERAAETPRSYGLQLEVRLTNGKILKRDFDITEQMAQQPRGGVITVSGINISDEEGRSGSSLFDVGVEGWGEQVDIDMTFTPSKD